VVQLVQKHHPLEQLIQSFKPSSVELCVSDQLLLANQEERMKLSKLSSVGLLAFTALAALTPSVDAHNPAKYIGVPFIVATACPQIDSGVSANILSSGGSLKLVDVIDGDGACGFNFYCSDPANPNGGLFGTFPTGVLAFNIAGLPATGSLTVNVTYSDGSTSSQVGLPPEINYVLSANTPKTVGSHVSSICVSISNGATPTTGVYNTVTLSNFRYNNAQTLFDTSLANRGGCGCGR
jgi:hypothetical protein